ncbi:MAG: hypothetical protein NT096_11110 [Proteobacteria bacterium]|nr:hypothetical protein [Pseudomonadota bacterium]
MITKVRIRSLLVSYLFVALSASICVASGAQEWKAFGENDEAFYFYDTKSVVRLADSHVRLQQKIVYTETGIRWAMEKHGPGYKTLNYAIGQVEIDCANKKVRVLSATAYSKNGSVLDSRTIKTKLWLDIPSGSMDERLQGDVCEAPSAANKNQSEGNTKSTEAGMKFVFGAIVVLVASWLFMTRKK